MRILSALLCVGVMAPGAFAQPTTHPVGPSAQATAVFIQTPPRIDGRLDEDFWMDLPAITEFVQRWPEDGGVPTERSEVRIAYDEDHLYFGLWFFDSEPGDIRANIFERGGRIDKDDHVWITLDTYDDDRNAYLFEMNPLGTQDDATITDESMSMDDWSWDAVYYSEGQIGPNGWTLEVAIPFRQIRFPKDRELVMGLAIERRINRKNERIIWPYIPREYQRGIIQVSQYGTLRGIENVHSGRNLEIKPYLIAGTQKSRADLSLRDAEYDFQREFGVDVKYGLASNLTLDLTYNTDFAQVEADNVQINLTRFNLFFPEKREFFLERAGLFAHGNPRRTQTFFSRRIGLTNDILAGARLTGQVGPTSVGLLNIQTRQDGCGSDALRDGCLPIAGTNNAVARVRTSVSPRATLGGIVTNHQELEVDGMSSSWNRVFGADAQIRFWSSSQFNAWYTRVADSDPLLDDAAGHVELELRNDLLGGGASFTSVGKRYAPALGFVQRRDMREYALMGIYSPLLESDRHPFRGAEVASRFRYIEGQDGVKQSWEYNLTAGLAFEKRDRISAEFERQFDRLEVPFSPRAGFEIPAGEYTFDRVRIGGGTDPSRRAFVTSRVVAGNWYSGTRTDLSTRFGFRQSKFLKFEGGVSHSIIQLPPGDFGATTLWLNTLVAGGRKLFASALVQYDNFSRDINANIRIDWIHTPGSDLFLVFNTSYHVAQDGEDLFDPRQDLFLNDRLGVAKLTYLVLL